MLAYMGNSPYDFILNHNEQHLKKMDGFVHRTFNLVDLLTFIEGLKHLYKHKNGLEGIFVKYQTNESLQPAIHELKKEFFNIPHLERTRNLPAWPHDWFCCEKSICTSDGWFAKIMQVWILAYGKIYHNLFFLVRLMFTQGPRCT